MSASQLGAVRKLGSLFSISSGWNILDASESIKLSYTSEVGGLKSLWNLGEKAGGVQGGRPHGLSARWGRGVITDIKQGERLTSRFPEALPFALVIQVRSVPKTKQTNKRLYFEPTL